MLNQNSGFSNNNVASFFSFTISVEDRDVYFCFGLCVMIHFPLSIPCSQDIKQFTGTRTQHAVAIEAS